jgi:hypothetical protein
MNPKKKQTFQIEVTRKEFLTLPMKIRRKALRAQAKAFSDKMRELQEIPITAKARLNELKGNP